MWTQILNESRSLRKMQNKTLIVLGSKHSGKRSLIDYLIDISKTNIYSKKFNINGDSNKMKQQATVKAIDYAYLNVNDLNDPDYRTHTKFQIYMIQQIEHPEIYQQIAKAQILKNCLIIIMIDFTNPWNFIIQLEKWIKFIYQLQKMAQLSISELEQMSQKIQRQYKIFKQPELDQNGKLKHLLYKDKQKEEEQLSLSLPEGVLTKNIRIPLMVCANKSDLQSQVLREDSTNKIQFILYNLRSQCIKYGASLIYTSIRNNSNLNLTYEYILHQAYGMPLKFKSQVINQQAIFIPFGYDKPFLINNFVVNIDTNRSYNEIIPFPTIKKQNKQEIFIEQDSKFFQKYINMNQSVVGVSTLQQQSQKPDQKKQKDVKRFFQSLLDNKKQTAVRPSMIQIHKANAEKQLSKHTSKILQKRKEQQ